MNSRCHTGGCRRGQASKQLGTALNTTPRHPVQQQSRQHRHPAQAGSTGNLPQSDASVDTTGGSSSSSSSSSSSRGGVQLPPPCDLGGAAPQARWNAVSLAYLGDAVWEAYLRSYFYGHDQLSELQLYNSRIAAKANTLAQSSCYELLTAQGWPTPAETDLMRWAANNSTVAPPKQATRLQYKQATALEVLVAYLYLTDSGRLHELMGWVLHPDRVDVWHRSQDARTNSNAAAQQRPRALEQGERQEGARRRRGRGS